MIGEISPRFDGYGFSLTGRSHMGTATPCQDSHLLTHQHGRWQLVAVADGVGSAPCSDQGSAAALSALAFRCESLLTHEGDAECLETLCAGFSYALDSVRQLAQESGRALSDYDTTLTACLYDGETVFIGHVGDGGVIGMDKESHYHLLTQVQKGEAWNEVCPLRFGDEFWVFEQAPMPCTAILLLTDGLLDQVAPSLLFGQPDPLYRGFVSTFLPSEVIASSTAAALPELEQTVGRWLCESKGEVSALASVVTGASPGTLLGQRLGEALAQDAYNHLTDDLTAAALWRRDVKPQPPEPSYLDEPDWEALRRERYDKLYPHLRAREESTDDTQKPTGAGEAPQ